MGQISPQYYPRQRAGSVKNDLGSAGGLSVLGNIRLPGTDRRSAAVDERHQHLHLRQRDDALGQQPRFIAAAGSALVESTVRWARILLGDIGRHAGNAGEHRRPSTG